MGYYDKKPITIEARQWNGSHLSASEIISWIMENDGSATFRCGQQCCDNELLLLINTLEGRTAASPQDYIIKGVEGEFYPCKPDIFHKSYVIP